MRGFGQGFDPDEVLWFSGALAGAVATFVADADGDGRADVVAVNLSSVTVALSNGVGFLPPTTWYAGQFRADYNLTVAPEPSAPRGFAEPATVGVYAPHHTFMVRPANTPGNASAGADYGGEGDLPVTGDWDGDGAASIGVYRPAFSPLNADPVGWWYLRNSITPGDADIPVFAYGQEDDVPVVGDWDGNRTTTVGVFRPAVSALNPGPDAWWYLSNSNSSAGIDIMVAFGRAGDVPVVGDWDGNWTVTIGVYRPSTREWLLRNSNDPGDPDIVIVYGEPSDIPIVGDWDGNLTTTIGLFRPPGSPSNPTEQSRWLLRNTNTAGPPEINFYWGKAGYVPVSGKWRLGR
jgi:hypothetical protein